MTDTAPQVGACEAWLDSGELDLNATRADYERAREIDAAFAALERQRDALLAACEAAAKRAHLWACQQELVIVFEECANAACTEVRAAIAAAKAGTP